MFLGDTQETVVLAPSAEPHFTSLYGACIGGVAMVLVLGPRVVALYSLDPVSLVAYKERPAQFVADSGGGYFSAAVCGSELHISTLAGYRDVFAVNVAGWAPSKSPQFALRFPVVEMVHVRCVDPAGASVKSPTLQSASELPGERVALLRGPSTWSISASGPCLMTAPHSISFSSCKAERLEKRFALSDTALAFVTCEEEVILSIDHSKSRSTVSLPEEPACLAFMDNVLLVATTHGVQCFSTAGERLARHVSNARFSDMTVVDNAFLCAIIHEEDRPVLWIRPIFNRVPASSCLGLPGAYYAAGEYLSLQYSLDGRSWMRCAAPLNATGHIADPSGTWIASHSTSHIHWAKIHLQHTTSLDIGIYSVLQMQWIPMDTPLLVILVRAHATELWIAQPGRTTSLATLVHRQTATRDISLITACGPGLLGIVLEGYILQVVRFVKSEANLSISLVFTASLQSIVASKTASPVESSGDNNRSTLPKIASLNASPVISSSHTLTGTSVAGNAPNESSQISSETPALLSTVPTLSSQNSSTSFQQTTAAVSQMAFSNTVKINCAAWQMHFWESLAGHQVLLLLIDGALYCVMVPCDRSAGNCESIARTLCPSGVHAFWVHEPCVGEVWIITATQDVSSLGLWRFPFSDMRPDATVSGLSSPPDAVVPKEHGGLLMFLRDAASGPGLPRMQRSLSLAAELLYAYLSNDSVSDTVFCGRVARGMLHDSDEASLHLQFLFLRIVDSPADRRVHLLERLQRRFAMSQFVSHQAWIRALGDFVRRIEVSDAAWVIEITGPLDNLVQSALEYGLYDSAWNVCRASGTTDTSIYAKFISAVLLPKSDTILPLDQTIAFVKAALLQASELDLDLSFDAEFLSRLAAMRFWPALNLLCPLTSNAGVTQELDARFYHSRSTLLPIPDAPLHQRVLTMLMFRMHYTGSVDVVDHLRSLLTTDIGELAQPTSLSAIAEYIQQAGYPSEAALWAFVVDDNVHALLSQGLEFEPAQIAKILNTL